MSLFSKIKYIFGAGDNYEEYEDDPETSIPDNAMSPSAENRKAEAPATAEIGDGQVDIIFTHVVETFNMALPDFLRSSVNPEAQRKYLYNTLAKDIRQYLTDVADNTRRNCEAENNRNKDVLQARIRELEAKIADSDKKREEISQKQLSSDRQRRALSDRVHDLEKQILTLESEKEQYQLEGKSMLNKLKVASVYEKELEGMRDELNASRTEISRLRAASAGAPQEAVTDEEREALNRQLEEVAKERKVLADKIAEVQSVQGQMAEVEAQISQFDEVKEKKDRQIASLKAQLEESRQRASDLENTLNNSLQLNQSSQDKLNDDVKRLNSEIADLKVQLQNAQKALAEAKAGKLQAADQEPAYRPSAPSRASTGAVNDILSDTDWIVSPASLKGPSRRSDRLDNQRKKNQGDDPQMSLF